VAVGLAVRQRDAQLVDPVADDRQHRRQQGDGGEDRHGDHERRRVSERRHQWDADDREREQRDHDRAAGEHHRAAGGRARAGDRLARVHTVAPLLEVTGDDEQRVVDPTPSPIIVASVGATVGTSET
jgi:hypothetical protein